MAWYVEVFCGMLLPYLTATVLVVRRDVRFTFVIYKSCEQVQKWGMHVNDRLELVRFARVKHFSKPDAAQTKTV